MTNEQIKEKYGIEPIMKEGWCWDDDKGKAEKCFCLGKVNRENSPFLIYLSDINYTATFQNFSETNPNIKEPKVGDWGWFWNENSTDWSLYGKIIEFQKKPTKYIAEIGEVSFGIIQLSNGFDNFSHQKPDFLP